MKKKTRKMKPERVWILVSKISGDLMVSFDGDRQFSRIYFRKKDAMNANNYQTIEVIPVEIREVRGKKK